MIIRTIMPKIKIKLSRLTRQSALRLAGFTLLESLLVLVTASSLVLLLSSQINPIFAQVRDHLFFLEFEHFYRESQYLSQSKGQEVFLHFSQEKISNGYASLELPPDIRGPEGLTLTFNESGGNNSLAKLNFQTDYKQVSYQLFLGSGKYKKTEN